jgi:hypothetical protein
MMDSDSHEINIGTGFLDETKIESMSSNDNASRTEMLWSSRLQEQMINWLSTITKQAARHNIAAKKKKLRFKVLGITSSLLVLVVSMMTPYIPMSRM